MPLSKEDVKIGLPVMSIFGPTFGIISSDVFRFMCEDGRLVDTASIICSNGIIIRYANLKAFNVYKGNNHARR